VVAGLVLFQPPAGGLLLVMMMTTAGALQVITTQVVKILGGKRPLTLA
jgi:hypothetical protein